MLENERTKSVQTSSDVHHKSYLDAFSKKSAFLQTLPKKFQMCVPYTALSSGFFCSWLMFWRDQSQREKKTWNTVFYTLSSPAGCLKDLFKWATPLANHSINCKMFDLTLYSLLCRNRRKFYQKSKPSGRLKARQPQCPATSAAIRTAGQHGQEHYLEWNIHCTTAKV